MDAIIIIALSDPPSSTWLYREVFDSGRGLIENKYSSLYWDYGARFQAGWMRESPSFESQMRHMSRTSADLGIATMND